MPVSAKRYINIVYVIVLLLACLYATIYQVGKSNLLKPFPNTSAIAMLKGYSPKPFAYRTLLPQMTHAIVFITPEAVAVSVGNAVSQMVQGETVTTLIKMAGWKGFVTDNIKGPIDVYAISVLVFLMWVALCVYGLALYWLCAFFFPRHRWMPYLTSLFGIFLVTPFIISVSKLYDFPVLALFALSMLFLYRQQWGAYLLCFALATLNKETSLLLTGLFALVYGRDMPRSQFIDLLKKQIVLFLVIIGVTRLMFINNHGSEYWHNLVPIVFSNFRDVGALHIVILIMGFRLVTAHWRKIPLPLRQSVWLFAACIVLYYFFGKYREYRVFFECFPGMTLIAGYTLFRPLEAPSDKGN